MKKVLLLCVLACVSALPAAAADSQGQAAGTAVATARSARIAGGQTVPLASSAKTAAQWAELRPGYQDLKPKKH